MPLCNNEHIAVSLNDYTILVKHYFNISHKSYVCCPSCQGNIYFHFFCSITMLLRAVHVSCLCLSTLWFFAVNCLLLAGSGVERLITGRVLGATFSLLHMLSVVLLLVFP